MSQALICSAMNVAAPPLWSSTKFSSTATIPRLMCARSRGSSASLRPASIRSPRRCARSTEFEPRTFCSRRRQKLVHMPSARSPTRGSAMRSRLNVSSLAAYSGELAILSMNDATNRSNSLRSGWFLSALTSSRNVNADVAIFFSRKPVRPIEIEQRRKLGADLLADRVERHRIGHQPVEGKEYFVEQALVTLVLRERGHQLRGERREFHRLNLIDELPCQETAQT